MASLPDTTGQGWVRRLISSLSLRLFIGLFAVIVVSFATYALVSQHTTATLWQQSIHEEAIRFSDLIQRSTQHSMLLHRHDDLSAVMNQVADIPGVEGVRVYDKTGQIIASSHPEEIGTQVDLQAEACVTCHVGPEPLATVPDGDRARVFNGTNGHRILGLINSIENSAECSAAACHAHPASQRVLGVLDVRMSLAPLDVRLAQARRQAGLGALVTALVAGLLAAAFIQRLVGRPVAILVQGAQQVAGGNLGVHIPVTGNSEIGRLSTAFNQMTQDLGQARVELTRWSQRLEDRLQEKTLELTRAQKQVTHMEKMASLGKLAATVAHELNNPLAGILNYAKLVDRTLIEDAPSDNRQAELQRYLQLIEQEATRSGDIVRNLLNFSRRSGGEFRPHHLNDILERAVMLIRHHLEISGMTLRMEKVEGDDLATCDADQVVQALVALLVNAMEAMEEGGTLTLMAGRRGENFLLQVADTGSGIPAEALPHIFEPFYSSKDRTQGAGLGLAVVYGIVQRHGGHIDVESQPGQGTTFRMVLPHRVPEQAGEAEEDHNAA
jgi:two-component system NtrC family sensor kinase